MNVDFNYINISYKQKNQKKISRWINDVVRDINKTLKTDFKIDRINIIFCNDNHLYKINKKYLHHNYFTDIITFDYSEGYVISGDLFISIDRIIENANKFSVKRDDEILRVIIHGILHLLGYKDNQIEERNIMKMLEDHSLKLYYL